MSKREFHSVLDQLMGDTKAFAGGSLDSPVVLYRHKRWHMIGIGNRIDFEMKIKRAILSVHFMSKARGEKMVEEWMPYRYVKPYSEVMPEFYKEVESKVLPTADHYRPLIRAGLVCLIAGYTTDTLHRMEMESVDRMISCLSIIMDKCPIGPYLRFK